MALVNNETLIKVAKILGGEEAKAIVEVLSQVDEITDEEIVSKTDIKLNTVRKLLYRLYDHSIVGLRRTRDKNTGWFIFHWRLQPDQVDRFLTNQKKH
ncbi:MAG: transcription factor, partial [Candidatus Bathyarchaeia archaeon]